MAQVQRQRSPTISVILPGGYSQRSCQRARARPANESECIGDGVKNNKCMCVYMYERGKERASFKPYRVRVPCSRASYKTASKWQDLQQVQSSE